MTSLLTPVLVSMVREARQAAVERLRATSGTMVAAAGAVVPGQDLVDVTAWRERADTDVRSAILVILAAGVDEAEQHLDGSGTLVPATVMAALSDDADRHLALIAQWGDTASSTVRALCDRAIRDGWTIERLEAEIQASSVLADATAERVAADEHHHIGMSAVAMTALVLGAPDRPMLKEWIAVNDDRCRASHMAAHGQIVTANNVFTLGVSLADYPGDPMLPPEERFNCFPAGTAVGHASVVAGMTSIYTGPMITVSTASGHRLAGTPNHPVLTERGWIGLGELAKGDHLFRCALDEHGPRGGHPDVDGAPPLIEEVLATLDRTGDAQRVPRVAVDFHGDRPDGDVDVVWADRPLRLPGHPQGGEPLDDLALALADVGLALEASDGAGRLGLGRVDLTAPSGMGSGGSRRPLLRRQAGGGHEVGGAPVAQGDPGSDQSVGDRVAAGPRAVGQGEDGLPGDVAPDEIVDVQVEAFHGPVFNLETTLGWYSANGFVVHNCRCELRWHKPGARTPQPGVGYPADETGAFVFDPNQPRDDHGRWAATDGTGANAEVVDGENLDDIWRKMGATVGDHPEERHPERYVAPPGGGTPRLLVGHKATMTKIIDGEAYQFDVTPLPEGMDVDQATEHFGGKSIWGYYGASADGRSRPLFEVPGSRRPIPYAYRIMDTEEWAQALDRGYIQSDQRMNLGDEGTVLSYESTGGFYAPPVGRKAVIVRVRNDPARVKLVGDGNDQYLKTKDPIPVDLVDLVSVAMDVKPGHGGYGKELHPIHPPRSKFTWVPSTFRDVGGQARRPKGDPHGGEWVDEDGGGGPVPDRSALYATEGTPERALARSEHIHPRFFREAADLYAYTRSKCPPGIVDSIDAIHKALPRTMLSSGMAKLLPETAEDLAQAVTQFAEEYPAAALNLSHIEVESPWITTPDGDVECSGVAAYVKRLPSWFTSLTIVAANAPPEDRPWLAVSPEYPVGWWLHSAQDDTAGVFQHELGHVVEFRERRRGDRIMQDTAGSDTSKMKSPSGEGWWNGVWVPVRTANLSDADESLMAAKVSQYALTSDFEAGAELWLTAHEGGRYDPARVPEPFRASVESMHRGAKMPMSVHDSDEGLEALLRGDEMFTVDRSTGEEIAPDVIIYWLVPPTDQEIVDKLAEIKTRSSHFETVAFTADQARRPKGDPRGGEWVKEGASVMPVTGTTPGDPRLPLYRFMAGEHDPARRDLGIHWTHDLEAVKQMASDENGYVIEADHPGLDHVLDWENPGDRPLMEREIGGYEYRDSVVPEVPIRPGAPMNVRAVWKSPGPSSEGSELVRVPAGQDASYRGAHQPSQDGPPANNLLDQGGEWSMPDDVYDHPEWYTGDPSSQWARDTIRVLRQYRGKPDDTPITVYRASPGPINPGDWVTLARGYAEQHAKHFEDPALDMPIHEITVPVSHIRFAGDDLSEWGYFPPGYVEKVPTTASLAWVPSTFREQARRPKGDPHGGEWVDEDGAETVASVLAGLPTPGDYNDGLAANREKVIAALGADGEALVHDPHGGEWVDEDGIDGVRVDPKQTSLFGHPSEPEPGTPKGPGDLAIGQTWSFEDGSTLRRVGATDIVGKAPDKAEWGKVRVVGRAPGERYLHTDADGQETELVFGEQRTWSLGDRAAVSQIREIIASKTRLADKIGDPQLKALSLTFDAPFAGINDLIAGVNRSDPTSIFIGPFHKWDSDRWKGARNSGKFMKVAATSSMTDYFIAHELGHARHFMVGGSAYSAEHLATNKRIVAELTKVMGSESRPSTFHGFSDYALQNPREMVAETHAQFILGGDLEPGPRAVARGMGWIT